MASHRPSQSPASRGVKRSHQDEAAPSPASSSTGTMTGASSSTADGYYSKSTHTPHESSPSAHSNSSSAFRNVSACNRCRLRKNRCDQNLPACSACEKARVKCVGYDPITKREIPRSYVYYLESRTNYLEHVLRDHAIDYIPADSFALDHRPTPERYGPSDDQHPSHQQPPPPHPYGAFAPDGRPIAAGKRESDASRAERDKLDKLVSNIGMVSVQGASDPRYLGSTSGISFARVVFAAVKNSVSGQGQQQPPGTDRARAKSVTGLLGTNSASMRESMFGLQHKPAINEAPFPDRELGRKLVHLYFEHANPQIPILHRGDFMSLFDRVYDAAEGDERNPRESYMLNIVFAIGAAIIYGSPEKKSPGDTTMTEDDSVQHEPPSKMQKTAAGIQYQPEEYHASAIIHLESFLGSSPLGDRPDGFGGGLEELQAVLLLASFALLRPVAPGLWYIVGVAGRLGVDLGLHHELGVDIDSGEQPPSDRKASLVPDGVSVDEKEKGRREWVRDLRRRLWWCVYSFDRLVSTCVGRPFGITDQVITTEFPSLLDDRFITPQGFVTPPPGAATPTYKLVSHHYFRLRLLQSEIQQVLQYEQTQQSRADGVNRSNHFMHTKLPSPFLQRFRSFNAWRADVDSRLYEWKTSAPEERATAVPYSPLLMELNYWQAVIVLYRQSLTAPPTLAEEAAAARDDMSEPSTLRLTERSDDEFIFLKVAEAGQKVLKLYRQLHRVGLVNYTFLATHHLFMAGISFLYALWHSPLVRSQLTLDDVDFTVLAATSVLEDLEQKCPPAEACRDAFNRMSRATIQMVLSTTGFGPGALYGVRGAPMVNVGISENPPGYGMMEYDATQAQAQAQAHAQAQLQAQAHAQAHAHAQAQAQAQAHAQAHAQIQAQAQAQAQGRSLPLSMSMPMPRFDMNLRDLFADEDTHIPPQRRPSHGIAPITLPPNFTMTPTSISATGNANLFAQSSPATSHVSTQPGGGYGVNPAAAAAAAAAAAQQSQLMGNVLDPNLSGPAMPPIHPGAPVFNEQPFGTSSDAGTAGGASANGAGGGATSAGPSPSSGPMQGPGQIPEQFNELHLLDAFPLGSGDFFHHDRNLDFFGIGGLDGSHDWRDGNNGGDMFDGFFFGGAGT